MRWNFEARKKRQKAVTEKIREANRTKPKITLPSIAITKEEEAEPKKKSQLRPYRGKYDYA